MDYLQNAQLEYSVAQKECINVDVSPVFFFALFSLSGECSLIELVLPMSQLSML